MFGHQTVAIYADKAKLARLYDIPIHKAGELEKWLSKNETVKENKAR